MRERSFGKKGGKLVVGYTEVKMVLRHPGRNRQSQY